MNEGYDQPPPRSDAAALLLKAEGVSVSFDTPSGLVPTIHDVDLKLRRGEILGLVGESGSGKSVTCQALLGLLPSNAALSGSMTLGAQKVGLTDRTALARLRGQQISMIFQDPMSALDPLMSVRRHLTQRLARHGVQGDLQDHALALLSRAGIADNERIFDAYPHQLSGGLCQRVAIALALAGSPDILVADEPTTALDVTIQAQVLDLFAELRASAGLSIILISHDLGVIAKVCDRVDVMYAGRIVESGPVSVVLQNPGHEYTRALLAARINIDAPPPQRRAIGTGSAPGLAVRDAGVSYRSNDGTHLRALDGVSLDVATGETLGIVGESGSGKSTLARMIMGLIPDADGAVMLDKQRIDHLPGRAWPTLAAAHAVCVSRPARRARSTNVDPGSGPRTAGHSPHWHPCGTPRRGGGNVGSRRSGARIPSGRTYRDLRRPATKGRACPGFGPAS